MGIADELNRLKLENQQLKWVIAQFMQRYGKDLVIFRMDNMTQFGIHFDSDPQKREITVRTKRVVDVEPATDTDGESGLN